MKNSGRTGSMVTRAITVVGLVMVMVSVTAVSAEGGRAVVRQSSFSGNINGAPVSYSGLAITEIPSLHATLDITGIDAAEYPATWNHFTKEEGKWNTNYWGANPDNFDLVDLCGGNYDVTTRWIESDGDTLTQVQQVSSSVSGDTAYVSITGVWSGTCNATLPCGTVHVEPIRGRLYQAGPNHVQMRYEQHWTDECQSHSLQVVKDIYYGGSKELPYDEIGTISNIVFQYDPGSQVEHVEYDLALFPAWEPVPSHSAWGMIALGILLLAFGMFYIRHRRRVLMA